MHRHFDGVRLVKAFNNILAHHIPQLARPSGAADRTALPIAGDHPEAKADAATLIDRLGFDTVDAGPLARPPTRSASMRQPPYGNSVPWICSLSTTAGG
ncbi:hypothetical protein [Micromonospora sicca]|uniref:hypothetical protein n=1 Tax=Micromonospora sicca TaxID=2202420 RepID=UPI001F198E1D|nr:hypothetical protein [Micromonospora sp. 4G51]